MKYITVPRSKEAEKRLDLNENIVGDLVEIKLNNDQFEELWKTKLISFLNESLNIHIDDFEDEVK